MDLVTFAGTGKYLLTRYRMGEREAPSEFVAEAIVRLFDGEHAIQRVLVGLTDASAAHENWPTMQDRLQRLGCEVVPVRIPDGRDEAALWRIFENLATAIPPESRAIIDITHALRHIPVIAVALACTLRETHGVCVERIVYGAFELKDPETGVAPIVDVSPFLEIIDWIIAARFLQVSGDARPLADLLKQPAPERRARKHGDALAHLGGGLEALSLALALNRPRQAGAEARKVLQRLEALPDAFEPNSAPFPLIRDSLQRTYGAIQETDMEGALRLVEWYIEHGRILQAVTLANEWLITYAGARANLPAEKRDDRERVARALSNAERRARKASVAEDARDAEEGPALPVDFYTPQYRNLIAARVLVSQVRNDIAHCGYREASMSAEKVMKQARSIGPRLRDLLQELQNGGMQ